MVREVEGQRGGRIGEGEWLLRERIGVVSMWSTFSGVITERL